MEDVLKFKSEHFGEIEVSADEFFTAVVPVPGFHDSNQYFFIEREKIAPFKWLQSSDDESLTFVVVEPNKFFHDFKPKFGIFDLKEIGLAPQDEPLIMAIVVLPEDLTKMTANLRGPLIMNPKKRLFKQVFIETDRWSVRESIVEGIKRKEKAIIEEKKAEQKNAGNT